MKNLGPEMFLGINAGISWDSLIFQVFAKGGLRGVYDSVHDVNDQAFIGFRGFGQIAVAALPDDAAAHGIYQGKKSA